jgi:hypothetical protein
MKRIFIALALVLLAINVGAHTDENAHDTDVNVHHAKLHASTHADGGADEVKVDDLATASTDITKVLKPDGAGGVAFGTNTVSNIYINAPSDKDLLLYDAADSRFEERTMAGDATIALDGTLTVKPPGSDKQVCFNDNGSRAGDSNLLWDKTATSFAINTSPSASYALVLRSNNTSETDGGFRVNSNDGATSGNYLTITRGSDTPGPDTGAIQVGDNSTWRNLALNPKGGSVSVVASTAQAGSILYVGTTGYFQMAQSVAGAPPAADCDVDGERGRMTFDRTNDRLYVCTGAGGWKYANLN